MYAFNRRDTPQTLIQSKAQLETTSPIFLTADKLLSLILIISAMLLYCILLYLHVLLYVALPKKLGGIKTFLYFTYFVGFWILLIYLLTEGVINFTGATLLIALSCVPQLFILRERVNNDMRILAGKLHLRKR